MHARCCNTALFYSLLCWGTLLLFSGCVDVIVVPLPRCDGILQPDEVTVDGTFDADGDQSFDEKNPDCKVAYAPEDLDCDDGNAAVYPGATEICNGIDDDCDDIQDEDLLLIDWYLDRDGDGYGTSTIKLQSCSEIAGYVTNSDDCDDDDSAIHPKVPEICDGIDQDCNGSIDEGSTIDYYPDADGDTFGNGMVEPTQACSPSEHFTTDRSDCDDGDENVHPGATETCEGTDQDCDGLIDEDAIGHTWYRDADADTFGDPNDTLIACTPPQGYVTTAEDCDDGDEHISPNATEACNSIDDDCDGAIDEPGAVGETTSFPDADADTFGDAQQSVTSCKASPEGYISRGGDCDDSNPDVYPNALELADGRDNDCDGVPECQDLSCDGRPDILLVNRFDGNAFVYFAEPTPDAAGYEYPSSPLTLACQSGSSEEAKKGAEDGLMVDIDLDGLLDVVISNSFTNSLCVFYGPFAPGSARAPDRSISAASPAFLAVGDLDNDAYPDIVAGAYGSNVTLVFSSGKVQILARPDAQVPAMGDLNGDQLPELVLAVYGSGTASTILWNRAGKLDLTDTTTLTTNAATYVAIGDLDLDGVNDLVFAAGYQGGVNAATIHWGELEQNGDAKYPVSTAISAPGAEWVVIADVNSAVGSCPDLVFAGYFDGDYSTTSDIYFGEGSGGKCSRGVWTRGEARHTGVSTLGATSVDVNDLNGDGDPDLIFAQGTNGTRYDYDAILYAGDGSGGLVPNPSQLNAYSAIAVRTRTTFRINR